MLVAVIGACGSALGAPPGGATADPAVTVHGKAVIHVMVKGGDGMIYDRAWSASTGWTGWISMGGPSYSSPALTTTWNNQEMFLFVRGTDNAIWYRRFLPQYFGWTNWSSLGGQTHLAPAGVSRVSSSAEVFLVGLDGKVQHRRFISSSNSWTSWMRVDDDCPPGAC